MTDSAPEPAPIEAKHELHLGLLAEPEGDWAGWWVAGGSQEIVAGVGVLFVVRPDTGRRMLAGPLSAAEVVQYTRALQTCIERSIAQVSVDEPRGPRGDPRAN